MRRRSIIPLLLTLGFVLAAFVGCSSDAEVELHEACDCIPHPSTTVGDSCGAAGLCEVVDLQRDPMTPPTGFEPALDCALTALSEGTPGIIRWDELVEDDHSLDGYLLIREDGLALWQERRQEHLLWTTSESVLVELSTDYYAGCMEVSDAVARFDCLTQRPAGSIEICEAEMVSEDF